MHLLGFSLDGCVSSMHHRFRSIFLEGSKSLIFSDGIGLGCHGEAMGSGQFFGGLSGSVDKSLVVIVDFFLLFASLGDKSGLSDDGSSLGFLSGTLSFDSGIHFILSFLFFKDGSISLVMGITRDLSSVGQGSVSGIQLSFHGGSGLLVKEVCIDLFFSDSSSTSEGLRELTISLLVIVPGFG